MRKSKFSETQIVGILKDAESGRRNVVTQTFGTMTADLLGLRDWLQAYGVDAS